MKNFQHQFFSDSVFERLKIEGIIPGSGIKASALSMMTPQSLHLDGPESFENYSALVSGKCYSFTLSCIEKLGLARDENAIRFGGGPAWCSTTISDLMTRIETNEQKDSLRVTIPPSPFRFSVAHVQ